MPSFPALDPPLAGLTVQVRPAAERDIPEILIAHQDDPALYAAVGLERPPSGAQLGRRIERSEADFADGTSAWLTIVAFGSEHCCGQISVHSVEWTHLRAELRMWVAPAQRGRGLGAGALALVSRWLLEACGLERVECFCEPANQAMAAAALSAGFVAEGMLRSYLRVGRGRVDARVLSLIAADLAIA